MKNYIQLSLTIIFFSIGSHSFSQNSITKDEKQVRAAIMDYVEGVYEVDTSRIYRSVHPTLAKRGTWYDEKRKKYSAFQEMNFQQLVNLTKGWNKDGKRANAKTIRDITIFDIQDKTASAKVVAAWGSDYFHLAKVDNNWYIINVLWQSQKTK